MRRQRPRKPDERNWSDRDQTEDRLFHFISAEGPSTHASSFSLFAESEKIESEKDCTWERDRSAKYSMQNGSYRCAKSVIRAYHWPVSFRLKRKSCPSCKGYKVHTNTIIQDGLAILSADSFSLFFIDVIVRMNRHFIWKWRTGHKTVALSFFEWLVSVCVFLASVVTMFLYVVKAVY